MYMCFKCIVYIIVFDVLSAQCFQGTDSEVCFPKYFMFGTATASYQIEGAWNVSGKGENMWDRYTHEHPERVFDHHNGDIAADSFHLYKEDVRLLTALGVNAYRFSISWSRVLPTGFSNVINDDGIRYYRSLIDELKKHGIEPLVTMYHWDLPQPLQDLGGWTNPDLAYYFVDYARVLLNNFGDIKHWLTFNEPLTFCHDGYGGIDAPGFRSSGFDDYLCAHTVLRAHGLVYRMFREKFNLKLDKFMGITLDFAWIGPLANNDEDNEAAETTRQFFLGWFAHPIFSKEGDYPPIMRKRIDDISIQQNFTRSRLPYFTKDEVETIKGAYDFLGFNHYTTYLATKGSGRISQIPSFDDDMGASLSQDPKWPKSNSTWLRVNPVGLRLALNWIKSTYNNPPILITENGISLEPGLQDERRIQYIDGYLRALHAAITSDKCNVYGYFYWSLIDNFEWMRGYSERFGLYEVDYTSPSRTRTARDSAKYYAKVATSHCLPDRRTGYKAGANYRLHLKYMNL